MSETTNLKLFKHDNPDTNENQFDVESALNDNWDKIDEACGDLENNKANKSDVNTSLQELEQDISNINNSIDYLGEEQEKLSDKLGLIEPQVENNESDIKNLQTTQEEQNDELKDLLNVLPEISDEEENINFKGTARMKFKEFVVKGNSKQESRSGKNKFDYKNATIKANSYVNISTGAITGTSSNSEATENYIEIEQKNYSIPAATSNFRLAFYDEDETFISSKNNNFINFEVPENAKYIRISDEDLSVIMLLEGNSEDIDYEEYGATPSPEIPSNIQNVVAKNLVSGEWEVGLYDSNGTFSFTDGVYRCFKKNLKAGTYIYSYKNGINLTQVRAVNLTTKSNFTTSNNSFTLTEDAEISLGFRKSDSTQWDLGEKLEDIEFQLEEGNIATNYEPKGIKLCVTDKNIANPEEIWKNMNAHNSNCSEVEEDGRECILFSNAAFRPDRLDNPFNLINYKYKENTAYTIRMLMKPQNIPGSGSGAVSIAVLYKDKTSVSQLIRADEAGENFVEFKVVTDASKTIERVGFSYGTSNRWFLDKSSIFIAEGDTTDYIANEQQEVVFPLEEGQRLYLGDYLANDGIHHVRKQIEFDGTENITVYSRNYTTGYAYRIPISGEVKPNSNLLCTKYKYIPFLEFYNVDTNIVEKCTTHDTGSTYVYFGSSKATVEDFKQEIAGSILEYELLEEEIEAYTQAQQEAYNQILKLKSYDDETNIYSTNETSPIFKVRAAKSLNSVVTQLNQLILENGGN